METRQQGDNRSTMIVALAIGGVVLVVCLAIVCIVGFLFLMGPSVSTVYSNIVILTPTP